jgi:hypothetical protein
MSIALNIPASNAVGVASNVSALDVNKTFQVGGTFGPNESVVIEGTADPAGLAGWNGVASFSSPTAGASLPTQTATAPGAVNLIDQPIQSVVAFMRVRRTSPLNVIGFAPTVSVDASSVATKNFVALTVPAGNGVGAITDVSTFGPILQFTIDGVFGPNELITIEAAQDGVVFDAIASFNSGFPQLEIVRGRYNSVRVRRSGA